MFQWLISVALALLVCSARAQDDCGLIGAVAAPYITNGAQGAWAFLEGSGTTTADLTGNGNTMTIANSPAWTTGMNGHGGGIVLTGTQYGSVPSPFGNFTNGPWTYSVWVNHSSIVNGACYSSEGAYSATGYYTQYQSSQLQFTAITTSSYTSMPSIPTGVWENIVISWNGIFCSMWTNGVSLSLTQNVSAVTSTGLNFYFMTYNATAANCIKGTAEQGILYNRALSAAEVTNMYEALPVWNKTLW